jgi:hypothetical protein
VKYISHLLQSFDNIRKRTVVVIDPGESSVTAKEVNVPLKISISEGNIELEGGKLTTWDWELRARVATSEYELPTFCAGEPAATR